MLGVSSIHSSNSFLKCLMFSEIGYFWEMFEKRSSHLKKAKEYYQKCLDHMCEDQITCTYHWYDRAVYFISCYQSKEEEFCRKFVKKATFEEEIENDRKQIVMSLNSIMIELNTQKLLRAEFKFKTKTIKIVLN